MANDAKKPKEQGKEQQNHQPKGGNQPAASTHCKFDGCKKGQDKFGFCMEHYEWYMAGIIRGDGKKPIDFEQKMRLFQEKQHRKVA